ncbi:MAG: hypothetical protein ACOX6H_00270 [Christensenellales bacterium]
MKQTLKYIISQFMQHRKFAEDKHSITIALSSAVIIFFSGFMANSNQIVQFLSALSIIFALISVLYSFFALTVKRVKTKSKHSATEGNLLDWKNVAKFDEELYLVALRKQYEFPKSYRFDNFDRNLATEAIALAKAVNFKFLYFNIALLFLGLSIVFGVIVICLVGTI